MDAGRIVEVREALTEFIDRVYAVVGVESVKALCSMRNYETEGMRALLESRQIVYWDNLIEFRYYDWFNAFSGYLSDFGLWNEPEDGIGESYCSVNSRYIVPIRDITGRVTALVGWAPDIKKYITTKTLGFVRGAQFFNAESYELAWKNFRGSTFLVEGIFDTLSLAALGVPALGNMGLDLTGIKSNYLNRYSKVVAIPDNDKAGRSTLPSLFVDGRHGKNLWRLPKQSAFVLFDGIISSLKDVDDLIKTANFAETGLEGYSEEFSKILVRARGFYRLNLN